MKNSNDTIRKRV